jgi:hypothetical protein
MYFGNITYFSVDFVRIHGNHPESIRKTHGIRPEHPFFGGPATEKFHLWHEWRIKSAMMWMSNHPETEDASQKLSVFR